jgi:hypothetical protein
MFLKNYTSEVPVSQTIYRIEQVLIRCGVSGITKEYGPVPNNEVTAIRFHLTLETGQEVTVRLPADVKKAEDALWANYAGADLGSDGKIAWNSRKKLKRADFADQAKRTAWKIVQDWIEVQMSMIQMRQAEFIEVFLPYVWDGRTTVFGRIKESGFRALLPEKTEAA